MLFLQIITPVVLLNLLGSVQNIERSFLSAYAINSDKQKGHIHHRNTYDPVGTLLGRFYCLNSDADQGDALAYDHSYWGSDVIYVQATNRVGFSFINSYGSIGK